MAINSITGAALGGVGPTATPTTHKNELDSDAFMQLLLAQLRNQNPLDPVQDKEFMAQMTQMNSLQELQKMNQTLSQLTAANKMSEAASLIGRKIEALLPDGSTVTGLVSSVNMVDGDVALLVGEKNVPLSALRKVSAQETTSHA